MAGKDDTGRRRAGRGAIRVNPQVLSWIIDSAGWRDGELASATGIDASLIGRWRARESEIDMNDIDNMAGKVGRPLSAFMIAEPPREAPVAGFRPGGADSPAGLPSKQVCTAVRLAREIQYNVQELRGYAAYEPASPSGGPLPPLLLPPPPAPPPPAVAVDCTDDPERVAAREAARMGLRGGRAGSRAPASHDRHGGIGPFYDALKDAVESRDVFVVQASFPVGEAKGLALVGDGPPVIVVNSADAAESRAFTLLHEYAHVLLAAGSLCRPAHECLEAADSGSGKAIEGWCDSFASSVLMPREEFLGALCADKGCDMDKILAALSQKFIQSRRAVLVRAIGLLEGPDREAYLSCYREMGPPPERPGSTEAGASHSTRHACTGAGSDTSSWYPTRKRPALSPIATWPCTWTSGRRTLTACGQG